jgi:hypothetical protein
VQRRKAVNVTQLGRDFVLSDGLSSGAEHQVRLISKPPQSRPSRKSGYKIPCFPLLETETYRNLICPPTMSSDPSPKALKLSQLYISIRNHSGAQASYYLVAVPSDEKNTNSLSPHTCVYQASLQVPSPNGSAVFPVTRQMVGICGTGKRKLEHGLKLFASDWATTKAATTSAKGSRLTMSLISQKEAAFDQVAESLSTEGEGKWTIEATKTFTIGNASEFDNARDDCVEYGGWQ